MKVLLVNPCIDFRTFGRYKKLLEPMPCIGLAYVAAVLEQRGHVVEAIDMFVEPLAADEIAERVRKRGVDVVGVGCLTPAAPTAMGIARAVKRRRPEIPVVLGNIHAGTFAHEILAEGCVDVVAHREADYIMADLVDALERGEDIAGVSGLSLRRPDGEIVDTAPRDNPEDLDALPYPAWHLFPYKHYGLLPFVTIDKPVLTVSASRGCPYACTYCSLIGYQGKRYRIREPKRVAEEIAWLHETFGVRQVGFVDPIFPLTKQYMRRFADEMEANGMAGKVSWVSETRTDVIQDAEIVDHLRRAGAKRMIFGMESGVDELLDNVDKKNAAETGRRAVELVRAGGLQAVGLFMIGLPGETPALTRKTIEYARNLDLDYAKFAISIPLPGSEIFEDLRRGGEPIRTDWENYTTFNTDPEKLVPMNKDFPPQTWIDLQKAATRAFYLRPRMIWRHLFQIRSLSLKNILYGLYSILL
ncbi:MAG: B12-binding domain-containing radical SAM protein [Candidatus Methylomirabilis sp.]|nr:B12-binding domain-containing radical SAM protein [Deltaproteobacteria bacterium]